MLSDKLNAKTKLVDIIVDNSTLGWTSDKPDGELMIADVMKDLGLGSLGINARRVREIVNNSNVYDKLPESVWLLLDGIAFCEVSRRTEFKPNRGKKREEFEDELNNCYILESYNKKTMPATIESCIVMMSLSIEYTLDNTLIQLEQGLTQTHIGILEKMGMSKDDLNGIGKADLYRKLKTKLVADIIANSTKNTIHMSKKTKLNFQELKEENEKQSVRTEFRRKVRDVIQTCAGIYSDMNSKLSEELVSTEKDKDRFRKVTEKYSGTAYKDFIQFVYNKVAKTDDMIELSDIAMRAKKESIRAEFEQALQCIENKEDMKEDSKYPARSYRIRQHIQYIENNKGVEKDKKKYVHDVNKGANGVKLQYPDRVMQEGLSLGIRYITGIEIEKFQELYDDVEKINKIIESNEELSI